MLDVIVIKLTTVLSTVEVLSDTVVRVCFRTLVVLDTITVGVTSVTKVVDVNKDVKCLTFVLTTRDVCVTGLTRVTF